MYLTVGHSLNYTLVKLHFEFVSNAWLVNSGWSLGGQYYAKKASADWMAMLLCAPKFNISDVTDYGSSLGAALEKN